MTRNWKNWVVVAGALMPGLMPGLAHAAGPALIGNWERDSGTVKIAVTQCGSNLCAVNTWVKRPDGAEKVGDKLILTVQPISGTELQGQAFDVKRQKSYKVTITVNGDHMETSGCVLLGIVCKSTEWKRIT